MTPETGRETIDFMLAGPPEVERISVFFFGGEPMLEWDLMQELVLYGERQAAALDRKIHFGMTTNGTIYDDEVDRFVVEHKLSINLSMDGGPATQNANRCTVDGRGSYELMLPTLKRLLERNSSQSVRMTFDARSVGSLRANIHHLWGLGCHSISPSAAVDDDWTEASLEVAREQTWALGRDVLAMLRQGRYRRLGFLEKGVQRIRRQSRRRPRQQCGAGVSYVAVDTDGTIYPCHRFVGYGGHPFGNLDSVTHPRNRELFLTFDSANIPGCEGCRARAICAGGCSAANFACTGSIMSASPLQCEFLRINYDVSKWLLEALQTENPEALERMLKDRSRRKRTSRPKRGSGAAGRSRKGGDGTGPRVHGEVKRSGREVVR
jgi:uncharacterized protein